MGNQLDELLKHALTPEDEPDIWLNQKIINQVKEHKKMTGRKKRRFPAAAIIAVMVICMSSVTVYAALKHLHPAEVAEKMQDVKLAEAFLSEQATVINKTQSYGDYSVTLLSLVSGEMLSEYQYDKEFESITADRTYAVIAIENVSGVSMPGTSEDGYGELEIFASPLIGDYNPAIYNIASMSGNYTDMTEDGVLYRILECDNVEIFADHNLYLCVSEGMFYNSEAYYFEKMTGQICRNETYEGLNALFDLPVDISKADPEKAAAYIASLGFESDIPEEKLNVELEETFEVEAAEESKEGAEVAKYALQFVGNPYIFGGESLTEGADCSGFTKSIYENFGISLPHAASEQCEFGMNVDAIEDAIPGDLVFYDTPSHVAIYIGDGMIVHSMSQDGICVSEVDFDEIVGIRRILNVE